MTTDNETTWASLDEQNAAHYAKNARPEWFTQAERSRANAEKAHDQATEAYLREAERYDSSPAKLDELLAKMLELELTWIAADLFVTECRFAILNNLPGPRTTFEEFLTKVTQAKSERGKTGK